MSNMPPRYYGIKRDSNKRDIREITLLPSPINHIFQQKAYPLIRRFRIKRSLLVRIVAFHRIIRIKFELAFSSNCIAN